MINCEDLAKASDLDVALRSWTAAAQICIAEGVASSFAPTRRFAWMLSLLVWAALIGDLVVLPALLAGPAGKWFRRR